MNRIIRYIYNYIWEIISPLYTMALDKKITRLSRKKEKTYYIICCKDKSLEAFGLFGYIGIFLQMINYAINHGMIPVIDMKNYKNSLLEDEEVGCIDGWTRLFKPIQSISLEEIYTNEAYVIGNHMTTDWNNRPGISEYHRKDRYWHWAHLYRRYIKLSDETKEYCDAEYSRIFETINPNDVLAVIARGTDLLAAKGHAIQPTIQSLIDEVRDVLLKEKFKYIYLATESQEIEKRIKEEFGEIVLTNKRTYYDNTDYSCGLATVSIQGKSRYERNLEYISSIMIVSKCGGLVAGHCGGAIGAYNINYGKYRYVYFFELGTVQ